MKLVGVCGGRKYTAREVVTRELAAVVNSARERVIIVHGDAPGADQCADQAARHLRLDVIRVPALWTEYGRSAGIRRNAIIASLPLSLLIAFPGGRGTADMVRRAREAEILVLEVA